MNDSDFLSSDRTVGADPSALPSRLGSYYEATVPDTLDLAERGRLGINHFTSIISEERDYEMYWYGDPIGMTFVFHAPLNCQPKCLEALGMERLMSGSQQNLEREAKMVEEMAAHLGDDGLYWMPWSREMPHECRHVLRPGEEAEDVSSDY